MQTTSKTIGSVFVLSLILLWSSLSYAQKPATGVDTPRRAPVLAPKSASGWDTQRTAASLKFGSLGFGSELVQSLRENVSVRFGINYYHGEYDGTKDDLDYDLTVNLQSWSLLADWFPYKGEFRVSTGFLYNGNNGELLGKPTDTMTIGDTRYPPSAIGTLTYTVDFRKFAPYLGIGVGNPIRKDRKLTFIFDFGIAFQGSPDVQLSADGELASDQAFQRDLKKEEEDLEDDIHEIKYYPVISFGLTYRFR
jgi:hypothetical protein